MLAPLRVTGVGGAFAAYAEGVDAIASNAAAAAVREPFSTTWFDWDLSFGVYLPAAFKGTDFDNDGKVGFTYDNFRFYTLGGAIKVGPFGLGVLGDFQNYDLTPNADATDPHVTATLGRIHAVAGWSLFGGQLDVGGGFRAVMLSFDASSESVRSTNVLSMRGLAPELGFLVRPDWEPWRIGATFRMPVEGTGAQPAPDPDGVVRAAGLVVPSSVHLPWELEAGFALQVGPRPLNPKWLDPHEQEAEVRADVERSRRERRAAQDAELSTIRDPRRMYERAEELARDEDAIRREEDERLELAKGKLLGERKARYWNWPRERITVLGEVLVTGPTNGAVSLESSFSQVEERSGAHATITPRLGLEGEPVPDHLQTRIGTYIEPSRFEGRVARQHFTFGFDFRLGAWSMFGFAGDQVWRLTGAVDVAPRYQNFGLSVGAWH